MNIQSVSYVNIDDFGFEDNFLSEAFSYALDVSFGDAEYTMISQDVLAYAICEHNNSLVDNMLESGVNAEAYKKLCDLPSDVYVNIERPNNITIY